MKYFPPSIPSFGCVRAEGGEIHVSREVEAILEIVDAVAVRVVDERGVADLGDGLQRLVVKRVPPLGVDR